MNMLDRVNHTDGLALREEGATLLPCKVNQAIAKSAQMRIL